MQIVLIGSKTGPGSGKDEVAKVFEAHGYEVKKFAQFLKQISASMLGVPISHFEDRDIKNTEIPGEWSFYKSNSTGEIYSNFNSEMPSDVTKISYSYRDFLIHIGTTLFRNQLHKDVFLNILFKDLHQDSKWVISDFRFYSEYLGTAHFADKVGGIKPFLINVERDSLNNDMTGESEREIFSPDIPWDIHLDNSSTLENLQENVRKVINQFKL